VWRPSAAREALGFQSTGGENLCRVATFRFIALPGSSEVKRDAGEVLGIFRCLKSVTGIIGGQEGDENDRIAATKEQSDSPVCKPVVS